MTCRHERRIGVDIVEGCAPLWIIGAAHSALLRIVADGGNEVAAARGAREPHLPCYLALPPMTVTAPITDHDETQRRCAPTLARPRTQQRRAAENGGIMPCGS
jgi:hypothetical protein